VKTAKETPVTPSVLQINFDEMAQMDISVNPAELQALPRRVPAPTTIAITLSDAEFEQSWIILTGKLAECLLNFLERSCT